MVVGMLRRPSDWGNETCQSRRVHDQEGTFLMQSSHAVDQLDICFDEEVLMEVVEGC
jgi:hypothetical protein